MYTYIYIYAYMFIYLCMYVLYYIYTYIHVYIYIRRSDMSRIWFLDSKALILTPTWQNALCLCVLAFLWRRFYYAWHWMHLSTTAGTLVFIRPCLPYFSRSGLHAPSSCSNLIQSIINIKIFWFTLCSERICSRVGCLKFYLLKILVGKC